MSKADPALPPETIEAREGARWLVVRTRARAEKQVVTFCQKRELGEVYLPLRRAVRRYEKSVRTTYLPLLPGYVFLCCDTAAKQLLSLECTATCGIIATNAHTEPNLIRDLQDLLALEMAQEHGELAVRPEIVEGSRIEINHGPFQGISGIIKQRRGTTRIIVNVELIGNSVTLEVNVDEVTPELG
jgi:transcription antitermination factor NusG